jgi:phage-related minor tail protein
MAGYIRGITIEFSADVQKLNAGLKTAQGAINKTQSELKSINRALKFNPGNTTLLKQKFDLLKKSVEQTEEKLDKLRAMQKKMKADGVDKNSAAYRELEREIVKTENQLKQATNELKRFGSVGKQQALAVGNAFQTAGGKIKSAGRTITTSVSVYGMAGIYAGSRLIEMSEKQAQAEQKLGEIYKSRMGVGKKAVKSTLQLASAQQKAGVVGDEVQIAAAQQLATYAKYPSTVNTMLPALNDLLVQQKGLNGTQEDATALANLFGKAMMGQTGALKRAGISFTDAQEEVLKYGTEEEKAAMIAEVVNQNVGDMNEEFAKTDAGKIQQAKNALGDMGEEIGAILLPAVADLVGWFQDNLLPKIQQLIDFMKQHPEIAKFALAFALITAALGPVLMVVGSLISMIGTIITIAPIIGPVLAGVSGPILAIAAAIAAAVAIGVILYKNWDTIKAKASALFGSVKTTFSKIKNAITKPFTDAWTKVKAVFDKLKGLFPLSVGKIFSNLKIPKIKIKGGKAPYGIGGFGTKPSISVSWHKKAMDNPYMFSDATLFGAGEAGDEMLYGRQALMRDIAQASGGSINYTALAAAIVSALTEVDTSIVLNIDGKNVADTTAPYMNTAINKLQARQERQLGFV